jgi:hypothetical protein
VREKGGPAAVAKEAADKVSERLSGRPAEALSALRDRLGRATPGPKQPTSTPARSVAAKPNAERERQRRERQKRREEREKALEHARPT